MTTATFNHRLDDLKEIKLDILADIFNQAFANYFIPLKITPPILADKIRSENIDLSLSIGCFHKDKLIGFILIGIDSRNGQQYAYNAGTGVLPSYRGQQLAMRMYQQLIAKLQQSAIRHHILEVIKENEVAINVYEQCGFNITNTYFCYRGKFQTDHPVPNFELREISFTDLANFSKHWDFTPTWQNTISTIERAGFYKAMGCIINSELAGYIIFDLGSGKVRQFAVARIHRKAGIGSQPFSYVQSLIGDKEIVITYIQVNDKATNSFLAQNGLKVFLDAYEMEAVF